MAKKLEQQTNFTAGELSPRLHAFVDVNKYKNGLKTATNVRILPQGPVSKRNGFKYIATTKDSTKITRLLKFQFSQTNAYILEFGNDIIRFYKNGAQVTSGGLPYEVVTTYLDTELADITFTQFSDTIYLAHPDHAPAQLVWAGDTSWTLSNIDFYPPITSEEGYAPAATLTPAATTGLGINFTAGSGVFLAADAGRQIRNLNGAGIASIVSVTSTTVVVCDIIENFPSTSAISSGNWKMDLSPVAEVKPTGGKVGSTITVYAIDASAKGHVSPNGTLTPAAATGAGVNFTSSAAGTFAATDVGKILVNLVGPGRATITAFTSATVVVCTINEDFPNVSVIAASNWEVETPIAAFRSADVGRYLLLQNGICSISSVVSSSKITCNVEKTLNQTDPTQIWSIEQTAWSSTNGYPSVVGFAQQRLVLASWEAKPQTVVMSASGLFDNLGVGSNDSDAIEVDIATNEVNKINWILNIRQDLVLGTSGAELSLNSGGGSLTPSTIQQVTRSYYGSNVQQVLPLGTEGVYYQRSGTKINSIRYDFSADTYISEDLTFLAEHITESGVKEMAWAAEPDRNIYAVLNDGTMAVGTYYKEQQIIGWTKFETDGTFESVQTISTGERDEVWVVVNRTINGSTKRYIERMDYTDGTTNTDGFSDSYLTYSSPKTVVSITKANPGVVTVTSHGYSNGNTVKFVDMDGMEDIEGITLTVRNATANTFTLEDSSGNAINTTLYDTFVSGTVHKLITTVSGLSHLEGELVQVKQDGAATSDKTVSGGSITLDSAGYELTVGLSYGMEVVTLNKEYNLGAGTEQGQRSQWIRPILRVLNSAYPTLSVPDATESAFKPARRPTDRMDKKLPLTTGDVVYSGLQWDSTGSLSITSSDPFPVVVLGIFGSIQGGNQ